jgi:hypothetical protein
LRNCCAPPDMMPCMYSIEEWVTQTTSVCFDWVLPKAE